MKVVSIRRYNAKVLVILIFIYTVYVCMYAVCMYVNFYLKAKRKKNDASLISYKLVSMRGVGTHLNK